MLKMCVTVQRYSTTIVYQYSLPMTTIALIAIVVPFFSGWLLQIGAKMLATSLFLLVENAAVDKSIGFGASPPKICTYNFLETHIFLKFFSRRCAFVCVHQDF